MFFIKKTIDRNTALFVILIALFVAEIGIGIGLYRIHKAQESLGKVLEWHSETNTMYRKALDQYLITERAKLGRETP